jgi:hypothetical protein
MIDERDWLEFHDGLDALALGDADDTLARRLAILADGIPDGPRMLTLARRLGEDRIDDLAARAPDALVDGTWDRLEAALPAPRRGSAGRPGAPAWSFRTMTGLATAAVIVLVFVSGFLMGERRQLQQRLDAWQAFERVPPGPESRRPSESPLLTADRTWTVGELRRLLARLPDRAVLADAADLERLLVSGPALRRGPARRLLTDQTVADGLTVAEARRLLDALADDAGTELDLKGLRLGASVLSF